ncbi:MAG: PadR family transcriptional regulator [Gemmatimonadota bacterium]
MLRTNQFHVLLALAEEDRHGSAIADDVLAQTEGSLRLWPATLYRTLDELVESGFIEELTGSRHPDGESKRRRYYSATPEGRAALSDTARRMSALAGTAQHRLGKAAS